MPVPKNMYCLSRMQFRIKNTGQELGQIPAENRVVGEKFPFLFDFQIHTKLATNTSPKLGCFGRI